MGQYFQSEKHINPEKISSKKEVIAMNQKTEKKLKNVLTVIGWVIIIFAIVALVMFILNSGVLR